jgi:hypothetical protein
MNSESVVQFVAEKSRGMSSEAVSQSVSQLVGE